MKVITSNVETIDNDYSTLKGVFRAIETAGRTCYKSVGTRCFRVPDTVKLPDWDEIVIRKGAPFDPFFYVSTPGGKKYDVLAEYEESEGASPYYVNMTAEKFVERMISRHHNGVLEHGIIYLTIPCESTGYQRFVEIEDFYTHNDYSIYDYDDAGNLYVTTNYRVIVENDRYDDLVFMGAPCEQHEKGFAVRITCSRSVSHEIVRHRVSFCQESQRFCNYSLGKFGNEVRMVLPEMIHDLYPDLTIDDIMKLPYTMENAPFIIWKESLECAEAGYLQLLKLGMKPEQARSVLPNDTATELVMTATESKWRNFVELRTSEHAHPDIRPIATAVMAIMEEVL